MKYEILDNKLEHIMVGEILVTVPRHASNKYFNMITEDEDGYIFLVDMHEGRILYDYKNMEEFKKMITGRIIDIGDEEYEDIVAVVDWVDVEHMLRGVLDNLT